MIHDRLGLDPLGNIGVKTGGATGGSTLWEAVKAVASGYSDCVLAMGWERMDEVPTDEGNFLISCAADKDWESPLGHIYTGYYAVMAQKYWQVFGKAEDSFRRTMAEISVKHHGYARFNPYAQAPMKITVDDVLESPVVAYPLRALDCCLMSVGAACAIICDEATALELTAGTANKPLRIWVTAGSHTLRPADRMNMEIPLLPNETADQYRDLGERFPGGERYPGFTGFLAARMSAYYAYRMTGIVDPMEDLDVIELHDAFTISDMQTYEDIGLQALRLRPRLRRIRRLLPHQPEDGEAGPAALQPLGRPHRLHARRGSHRDHAGLRDRHPPVGPLGRDPRRRGSGGSATRGRSRPTGPTCRSRGPSEAWRSATPGSAPT